MQRLNVWKWAPLRSCNVRQKLTEWDLKALKQEKQEDSIHGERRTLPLPPSDPALCTEQPGWTRLCRWRDWAHRRHCRPWLLSARMAAWVLPPLVGGWQGAGLTLVPCPLLLREKHQEKRKRQGASAPSPPGQPRSGQPLSVSLGRAGSTTSGGSGSCPPTGGSPPTNVKFYVLFNSKGRKMSTQGCYHDNHVTISLTWIPSSSFFSIYLYADAVIKFRFFLMEEETSKAEVPGAHGRPRSAWSLVAAACLRPAHVVSLAVNHVCPPAPLQGCVKLRQQVSHAFQRRRQVLCSQTLYRLKWETVIC